MTLRKTSICGLGQVALGPVVSVLGLQRGGAGRARPQPRDTDVQRRARMPGREFFTSPDRRAGARRLPAGAGGPRSRRCRSPRRSAGCRPRRSGAGRAARLRPVDRRRLRGARRRHLRRVGRACRATSTSSGRSRWAARPRSPSRPGTAVAMPTGGVLPARRRRGGDGRAHPGDDARHDRGGPRRSRRARDRARRRGRARRGAARARRPAAARRRTSACSRPPASPRWRVRARPRVAIVSTGDEVVPPGTGPCAPGQVRDATASALAALVPEAGGEPAPRGIVPDDRRRARRGRCARRSPRATSWSSRRVVGRRAGRDRRRRSAALGAPGICCHGLAIRPGKPTLLAECGGVPVIGLPGQPAVGAGGVPARRAAGAAPRRRA